MRAQKKYLRYALRESIIGFICLFILSFSQAVPALAHKTSIFAWVEGDTVYTESKFSGGKRVKEGEIVVYDPGGNQLLKGKTNKRGEFSFKVPKKTALKIVLQTGMGHRAEWTVPLEEIQGITSDSPENQSLQKMTPKELGKQTRSVSVETLTTDDIQLIVEKTLEKKLKPIMAMLADSQDRAPTLRDILGGIGYILGLVGMASYFHYRWKKLLSA